MFLIQLCILLYLICLTISVHPIYLHDMMDRACKQLRMRVRLRKQVCARYDLRSLSLQTARSLLVSCDQSLQVVSSRREISVVVVVEKFGPVRMHDICVLILSLNICLMLLCKFNIFLKMIRAIKSAELCSLLSTS